MSLICVQNLLFLTNVHTHTSFCTECVGGCAGTTSRHAVLAPTLSSCTARPPRKRQDMIGTAFPLLLMALIMVCLMVARTMPAPLYALPAVPAIASFTANTSLENEAGRALGQRRRRRQERAAARAGAAPPAIEQPQPHPSVDNLTDVADARCHAAPNTGYAGDGAVVWGLGKPGFHLPTASECCKACTAHNEICGAENARGKSWWPARPEMHCGGDRSVACTIWTWCPVERCFAFDIHKHEFGECWLSESAGGSRSAHRRLRLPPSPCCRALGSILTRTLIDSHARARAHSATRRIPKGHAADAKRAEHEDNPEAEGSAFWTQGLPGEDAACASAHLAMGGI